MKYKHTLIFSTLCFLGILFVYYIMPKNSNSTTIKEPDASPEHKLEKQFQIHNKEERSPRNTTPTLDVVAKEGVAFSRTMATASWTMPAVMSVLTSLYPEVHGTNNYDKKLPESVPTLAEILKENGYKTVASDTNYYRWIK